ncbi:glycosyltransferase family 9 protein [Xenorhabdus sp. 12]|uniref:Glycosyltransferase family 9 protein n=1 Tax=Xenorhabdus santafensis TaxID=2582833 RepID=A0ABU4S5A2_9GAMM|nr:glycosyltransferase family 9 protein [Xenorhabdus sp. 12]MDX7986392.1 glycosyltransferase family 9 protein [Xenorhabdus sp. 12]
MKKKRFSTLRAWNRKRNYLMKDLRYYVRLIVAKFIWDKNRKNALDINIIKSVLLLRNEGKIGDMIVDTILLRELSKSGYQVDVLATVTNSIILKYNPYVRDVYLADNIDTPSFIKNYFHNIPSETINVLKSNNYDLVIDTSLFDTPIHRLNLFKQINAKNVVGFNKEKWLNCYTKNIQFDFNENHVKLTSREIMHFLNKNVGDFNYELYYPNEINIKIKKFINELRLKSKKIIVINSFAGDAERCLSIVQLKKITEKLRNSYKDISMVFLDHEDKIDIAEFSDVYKYQSESLHHTISLISHADLIISPDTSIVHISAAYKKPLIAIYQDFKSNKKLWEPGYDEAIQILATHGKLHENKDIDDIIAESVKKIFPV